jgi:hypothetical protein
MRRRVLAFAALATLAGAAVLIIGRPHAQGLAALIRPREPFSAASAPPAPDYANPGAWSAWPGAPSRASEVPPDASAHDNEASARADVFFIQPTTYLIGQGWNAAYDQGGLAKRMLEDGVLPDQASAFNGCCRIFAPRYRQAILAAFFGETPDGDAALDLAYSDVLRAFDYYIAHENHGRPFIIAAHSQGSLHAMRLIQERVIGTPLARRLVAVYAIGSFLPTDIQARGMPICRSARQTRCAIDWNSVSPDGAEARRRGGGLIWLDGRYQPFGDHRVVCVNPLDWRPDSAAPAGANLGSEPPAQGAALSKPIPGQIDAACKDGMLQVDIPAGLDRDFLGPLTRGGVYHVLDYNLFYMNIRKNADARVAAFTGW